MRKSKRHRDREIETDRDRGKDEEGFIQLN